MLTFLLIRISIIGGNDWQRRNTLTKHNKQNILSKTSNKQTEQYTIVHNFIKSTKHWIYQKFAYTWKSTGRDYSLSKYRGTIDSQEK